MLILRCKILQIKLIPSILCNLIIIAGTSVEQCCRDKEVPEKFVKTLCNPGKPPSDFDVYDIFEGQHNCSSYLASIAQCLVQGRNNHRCCSMEAKDLDENACFGLCRGEGAFITSHSSYQTCVALNIASMFSCFEKSYSRIPSFPRNVNLQEITATEVQVSWEEPEFNPSLVDHYKLKIFELDAEGEPDLGTKKQIATVNTQTLITNLEAGTRYLLEVIAHASSDANDNTTDNDDDINCSLPSEIRFKTQGTKPKVMAFKEKIYAPLNSNSIVGCQIKKRIHMRIGPEIKWEHKMEKKGNGGHFKPIKLNDRIISDFYLFKNSRPKELIATLQIKNIISEDYGLFRCIVSDEYGEGHAVIQLTDSQVELSAENPPESISECCVRQKVSERCLSMCGSNDVESRRYVPRPFMSYNCSIEIPKVLSCAMQKIDESTCCITKRLPMECLYLCDHHYSVHMLMPPLCVDYLGAVEDCRTNGISNRPGAVEKLKAHNSGNNKNSSMWIRFDHSERANSYIIYWRHQNGPWQYRSVSGTTNKMDISADEIVVVAVNAFGQSAPSRLTLHGTKWK